MSGPAPGPPQPDPGAPVRPAAETEAAADPRQRPETELGEEIQRGQDENHPLRRRLRAFQDWSHRGSRLRRVLVIGTVSIVGFALLAAGVVMWFIPGPGWLFVFLGIGVWSLEFTWAERLNGWALRQLARLWAWWRDTRLVGWWRWCVSGPAERSQRAGEAAEAQRRGRPVRSGARNDPPGA